VGTAVSADHGSHWAYSTSDDPNGPVARMRSVGGASRRAAVRGATPPPFAPSTKPGRGVPMKVSESHEGSDSDNASRSHDDCAHAYQLAVCTIDGPCSSVP
jgi:hypothetical protein